MALPDIKVSVGEVCEVRGAGLDALELLAIVASASDQLPPCPRGTVFDPDHVFISSNGELEIKTVAQTKVERDFVPPEWAKGDEDAGAAAVYCLGAVLRAAGAEQSSDADLLSLVNILTVPMVGTRPKAHRMGQMARNQLKGREPKGILIRVYEEIMGDEESNQLEINDSDLELEDEFHSPISPMPARITPNHLEATSSQIPSVSAAKIPAIVEPSPPKTVKKAVDYVESDDDDSDSDKLSTSSSSSSSSASSAHINVKKNEVPFDTFKNSPHANALNKEDQVVPTLPPQQRASPPREESVANVFGSPMSSKLNETYIEEEEIDMSDDTPDSGYHPSRTAGSLPESTSTVQKARQNPFDSDDDFTETRQLSLSGRDPFAAMSTENEKPKAQKNLADANEMLGRSFEEKPTKRLAHKFSSSEDEIVQVDIDEFDDKPPQPKKSYFDDVVRKEEEIQPSPEEEESWRKTRKDVQRSHSSSFSSMQDASSRRTSSKASSSFSDEVVEEVAMSKRPPPPVEEPPPERPARRTSHPEPALMMAEKRTEPTTPSVAASARYRYGRDATTTLSQEFDEIDHSIPPRQPVDVTVFTEQPAAAKRLPPLVTPIEEDEDDIDRVFEEAQRSKSQANIRDPIEEERAKPRPAPLGASAHTNGVRSTSTVVGGGVKPNVADSPHFERRNSLVPSRISGRQSSTRSMRGKRKTRAVPEFYDYGRHSSIRLKAPNAKKKKITIMRVEDTDVFVELLNGQKIEVLCRSDMVARDIFSLVVQHMNINEHIFFGLSVLKDGEHFFLEDHQRLEKFAPPGWKNPKASHRNSYVLYLRFKFYPQILEFIKTDVTMHELYLQVRRDVIDERIQPKRDAAFELAALALQAEFGNRPPPAVLDYFDNHHYLSKRYCSNDDPKRLQGILADMHQHYTGMKTADAEHKFIQICQRHREFGAHLHRVFRIKPIGPMSPSPFDPDSSTLWIGIMPRGICVYDEKHGTQRDQISEFLWQDTQTLQFDKKKFVIVANRSMEHSENVFFADHHSNKFVWLRSSYFVKFAAAQHRFMIKMRQWKSTLRHENTIQAMPDVCVEGRSPPPGSVRALDSPLEHAESMFEKMPSPTSAARRRASGKAGAAAGPNTSGYASGSPSAGSAYAAKSARPRSMDAETLSPNGFAARASEDADDLYNSSKVERFEVLKHAAKENGDDGLPGMRFEAVLEKDPTTGLGLTLVDGNLNDIKGVYVKSVADNGAGMKAGICVGDRLLAVNGRSMEGCDRHRAVDLVKAAGNVVKMQIHRIDGVVRHDRSTSRDAAEARQKANTIGPASGIAAAQAAQKGVSRTPPAPRRAANRRVRAVSDFGAIGDMLPAFDSDNIVDIKAISGLHLDESEDEERGEYRLPTTSMYSFDTHQDDEDLAPVQRRPPSAGGKSSPAPRAARTSAASEAKNRKYRNRKSNLDWAEELEEEVTEPQSNDGTIFVRLERNNVGSLGVQIASSGGKVHIKNLTAEPAVGHPELQIGDVLLSVNGESVSGKTHQEVVAMLRSGGAVVTLGLKRETATNSPTITAVLKRKPGGTLGLSLAKRTGSDGIFIRMIAEESAAASDGTLNVGDRIVSIDDKTVEGLSPSAILERLRSIDGDVRVVVSRQPSS